jgi:hypothetical protein
MTVTKSFFAKLPVAALCIAIATAGSAPVVLAGDNSWARVTEDNRAITIEPDNLEAVIPKNHPKQWVCSPSSLRPSSIKNALAASRSSTTMRTLSIRLSVTSFLRSLH